MSMLDSRKAIWMWEFSQQAEKTIVAAARTARDLAGADLLFVKAMDGMDWMSRFDPDGYGSLARLRDDTAAAAAEGIAAIPWVVVKGADPAAEAAAHALLGPALICDVEPYSGFFSGPPQHLTDYLAALRANGVTEIHLSIDPRPSALASLDGPASWSGRIDGLLPQAYWTDFGIAATAVLPMIRSLAGEGVPVYPVFPGDAAAQDLADVWTLAQASGCAGVSVWRLGAMDSGQLSSFKSIALSLPGGEPSGTLEARVGELETRVERLNDVLVRRFALVRAALDPDAAPA